MPHTRDKGRLFVILEKKKREGKSGNLKKALIDLKKIEIEQEVRWHTSSPEEARFLWLMHWQEVEDYYSKIQEIIREGERLLQQEEQLNNQED